MEIEKEVLAANGFAEFNPMQKKALEQGLFDQSVVVSAPTSSGKTIIAELCALDFIINKKKKVIYTCPLRALASEHFADLKKKFSKHLNIRMAISTGDIDSSSSYLQNYDLIFTTYEKLNSLIRHRASWLSSVGLLIIDEVHEIDSDRGPTIEMTVSMLRHTVPSLRFLALSATIPNAKELAGWLGAKLVESDFRPVKLAQGVLFDGVLDFKDSKQILEKKADALSSIVFDTLKKQKQAIVFANTRKRSGGMAKKLAALTAKALTEKEKITLLNASQKILSALESPTEQCRELSEAVKNGCAFHNAGLLSSQREIVEEMFRGRVLKIVCATPTISMGVNMPAFRVVIPSLYRYTAAGNQRIPVREYKQMCLPYEFQLFTKEFGWCQIGEIVEKKLNCSVLSMNISNMKQEFKQVVNYFEMESAKLLELDLKHGAPITLTSNHPVLISTKNGFEWIPSGELKGNDRVVSLKGRPDSDFQLPYLFEQLPKSCYTVGASKLFAEAMSLNISQKSLSNLLGVNAKNIFGMKTGRKAIPFKIANKLCDLLGYSKERKAEVFRFVKSRFGKTIKLPANPTKKFLWLAGFIATDGTITKLIDKRTNSVYVNVKAFNTNPLLISKAEDCFAELGLVPYKNKREDGLISLELGSTLLADIFVNYYGLKYGAKSTTVEVPKFLENAPPKLIGAYLGGVFDGDGNISIISQKKGKNSKNYCGLVVTGSEKFAFGIQRLMHNIGIISTIEKHKQGNHVVLKGKEVFFSKPFYNIIFHKIEYLHKFSQLVLSEKGRQIAIYSSYHNLNKRDFSGQEYFLDTITGVKKLNSKKKVYNITVSGNNNYFAESLLLHNCGRAGRPRYDAEGQSILFANSSMEADELFETYINGKIESVYSKLGIESVLRTHLLCAIALNFVFDIASMEEFFSKTFYAFQYRDMGAFFEKVSRTLKELEQMGFVKSNGKKICATALGARVSELFLDPLSAHKMALALKQGKPFDLSYIFMITDTSEFSPQFSVPKKSEPELWERLHEEKELLPVSVEQDMFFDPNILSKFHSTLLLSDWINEVAEETLLKQFNTAPGLLHSKLLICDWLVYCVQELSKLLELKHHGSALNRLRKRLKHGVKEELVFLTELRGIGRVRARRLFRANIRTIADVKKTDIADLEKIIPPTIARLVKEQLKSA